MKPAVKIVISIILLGACVVFFMKYKTNIKDRTIKFLEVDQDSAQEMKIIGSSKKFNPRVKELQQNLFKMGYGSGVVDGLMGKATREAIKKFQREKKIEPTGKVNKKTFLELQRRVLKDSKFVTPEGFKNKKMVIDGKANPLAIKEKIKEIQKMLKSLGFYDGKIDGVMGKGTIEGIRKAEKSSISSSPQSGLKSQ